jgi:predicted ester cyclase
VAEADLVVERFTAHGTHRGELLGVPATGRELVLPGINIFRIADDRIVERWGCVDMLGLLRPLGVLPG